MQANKISILYQNQILNEITNVKYIKYSKIKNNKMYFYISRKSCESFYLLSVFQGYF